jgi:hypothetical protein
MGVWLFTNVWALVFGLFFVGWDQYVLKTVSVALGGYFIYGGLVLVGLAHHAGRTGGEQIVPPDRQETAPASR